jgi:hypothetical protein
MGVRAPLTMAPALDARSHHIGLNPIGVEQAAGTTDTHPTASSVRLANRSPTQRLSHDKATGREPVGRVTSSEAAVVVPTTQIQGFSVIDPDRRGRLEFVRRMKMKQKPFQST